MESETGPEEGGSTPGSWILVVSPGLHEGGALGPSSPVGAAEAMQAAGGAPGEEAALFWVEAVEEGAAVEEGEVAGLGQEFQLLVLDVMEEVEVVAYEEQEQVSSEEHVHDHPRPGALSDRPALEALAALQLELEPVNQKAQRAHARLKHKTSQRRKVHLEHRSAIIQGIRGFWVEVVSLGVVLVEEFRHPTRHCKITLSFRRNRYFQNEVIVKEYLMKVTGYHASRSTPVQWHQGFEQKAYRRRHHDSSVNFFNWFFDHNFTGSDWIAEIIIRDLWPNPLQYYVRRKAAPRKVPGEREEPDPPSF
ncbi:testis-specific Y-encoded protein 3-like isoform X2 [Bos javanicus]|uniref:testis-specific Y-encoded protein 3-like isoform X2 n=1 Tax=Bos javanicus TaxID=9906 RepID=UPI002AA7435B|nr:testis-specific Y-encoded protein 3-like isoform X2 [Bos javanicus]XP_061266573.1 testis-specific Y-encoded protein 3-like isoform X2 [Bos javanicus]XP_061266579.1 testis-specific Y-encoded protein 3-like isoform X2 [Bos javanicus]XP_061266581.1 testis-specific Y-encoded protein 3-like isoform X2 [Bos javanicus]XP_061266584.1 testis-specific Y-encoded protein 3-like isoform X2 [Bos javanicus]XP_061266587.1 testis-specific Y-encoded protein 3-like isoform X2 [Bos javanicus]XP_061266589.1 te